mgnify:CR=1 FL=1
MSLSGRVVKVDSWEAFRHIVIEYSPESLAYRIEPGIPARHLTGLRLILPAVGIQYVFIDTAIGDRLAKTGIRLQTDERGNRYVKDEDVLLFVRSELGRNDLKMHPYWTI